MGLGDRADMVGGGASQASTHINKIARRLVDDSYDNVLHIGSPMRQ
jgi:hypothetical protein